MTEERKDEYKPDAKEEKKENSDSEETAILYESLSSEERKRLIADRLADAIQEIFPPPEVWKSMSHEEKINYLVKKDEGFLLPLAFAKAWIRGIQGIDLEDLEKIISLAKTTMTPQERERLKVFWDKKISYNDKPLIILDILDDMIGADYLGAVNMKVSETEEGELYLYFPPERILTNAKEILDFLILRGISSACKMREVIAVV
jgi:phage terminase large subunit